MNDKTLTYKKNTNSADMLRYAKAVGFPISIFLLAVFTIAKFAAFGVDIIAPLTGVMWVVGVGAAFLLPSHRISILAETHYTIGGYLGGLIMIRAAISLVSGVSAEMLMATYNQAIPMTSGSTVSGYLQTLLWITAIMTPVGFIGMEGKKVLQFKRKANKIRAFDQLRGIRSNGNGHME